MSQKWSSSKKISVSGAAFKRARLKFKNMSESLKRGEYGLGSQEWLAEQAKVSPRTVYEIEAGSATLKTVDAVSSVLGIKGREFIKGYGVDFTTFRTPGVVDFRPTINGRLSKDTNKEAYLNSPFLVTLDPIVITVDDDFTDKAKLKCMRFTLSIDDMNIDFTWLYNVQLTSRSSTWLGDEKDIGEVDIFTEEPYKQSIMFRQESFKTITWKQFIDCVIASAESRILLTLKLEFENFNKQGYVMVSVEEIKNLCEIGFPPKYPYWIQPRGIMV